MTFENGACLTTIRVRYAETDKMGVAYNSHYLTWFEVGRTELLRDLCMTYATFERMGFRLPLIEAGIKYLKPVYYDDVLTVISSLGEKPGVRLRINYEIVKNGDKVATGFTEHAFTDEHLRPVKPPKKIHEQFNILWKNSLQTED